MTSANTAQHTDIQAQVETIGRQARDAQRLLALASSEQKNKALHAAADALLAAKDEIITANAKDMNLAKENGISGAMLDRLLLNEERIEAMAEGMRQIAALPEPTGKQLAEWDRPNGLKISRVSVPLGVIGIIYESRPNVTADAGALCLKSGNAAILRGGSESFFSSGRILQNLQKGLKAAGLPEFAIQSIPTKDRAAVGAMLRLSDYIDVIVPRGGKGLIQRVIEESKVPTLQHLDGNCHCYIEKSADLDKAVEIVVNAKMRRTGVCGATESIVIDRAIAPKVLPLLTDALLEKGCEIRGDDAAQELDSRLNAATDEDFYTEYLDAIVSVKIVDGIDEAVPFINEHSSGHTDAIITEDDAAANRYLQQIDSAIVVHNASTQFADGGEFGMGAEIGIATGRLHARGPVGVEQLTTYKYNLRGTGQTRP